MDFIATAGFGIEAVLARELETLGYQARTLRPGWVGFQGGIDALVKADDRIDLFEYTLQKMVLWTLDAHFGLRKPTRTQYYGVGQLWPHLAVVLGTLARAGHSQDQQAEAAFEASMQCLDLSGSLPPREACSLQTFDQSLVELSKVSIPIRQKILEACRICVTADQQVTTRERELVRAVAAVLECPTPIAVPHA